MVACPVCGKETTQTDAQYCLFCGASLQQQQAQQWGNSTMAAPRPRGYLSSEGSSFDFSTQYERALKRVEQLSAVVLVMSIVTVILIII